MATFYIVQNLREEKYERMEREIFHLFNSSQVNRNTWKRG